MVLLQALFLILIWHPAFATTCDSQLKIYQKMLSDLPANCDRDEDCGLAEINWDSCQGLHAFAKDGLDGASLSALQAYRHQLKKECHDIANQCSPSAQGLPYCFEKKCDVTLPDGQDTSKKDFFINIVFVNRHTKAILANNEFILTTRNTIYCAMAPCPQPAPQIHKLKTDGQGILALSIDIISADNLFSLNGFRPQSFNHDNLIKLRGRKLGFDTL